uniref:Uncharacterized protein n=1 Tax=Mycena chlorophos TaxID=658473 RepID=A0ABQ0L6S6_MYCCL|nr:predicted protein [Mycena chlorophos]
MSHFKFHLPHIFHRRQTTSPRAANGSGATGKRLSRSQSTPHLSVPIEDTSSSFPVELGRRTPMLPTVEPVLPLAVEMPRAIPHFTEAPAIHSASTQLQMPVPEVNVIDPSVVDPSTGTAGARAVTVNHELSATADKQGTLDIPHELEVTMWHGGEASSKGKIEKEMDQLNKDEQLVNNTATSNNAVAFVKDLGSNELVQDFGKKVLAGIPYLMDGLEELSKIHPFVRRRSPAIHILLWLKIQVAYLPFKESERRENDDRRAKLFSYIKDVMLVLLELKNLSQSEQLRQTPEGTTIGRVEQVCIEMKSDIVNCYNVLNAQEKRSFTIKFLKASVWSKELAIYADRFDKRRKELDSALTVRIANEVHQVNDKMDMVLEHPQEQKIEEWIRQNGNANAVLNSDTKCAQLLEYEAKLPGSSAHSLPGAPSSGKSEDDKRQANQKAVTALRKEYREDIQRIIQDNLQAFATKFEVSLEGLAKDLVEKIEHQGDRVIHYLERSGPKSRIRDKIVYHVWKDQDWKGSAETPRLVRALCDYLVERVERSKLVELKKVKSRPLSTVAASFKDDDEDPDMDSALPDDWITSYLLPKRLRYLQRAVDLDSSGSTTVSEINAFTRARPTNWSLPHWIGYWLIGWQLSATRYCIEIESIWQDMFMLKQEIGIRMPGNQAQVDTYISLIWTRVTALTSSIERYDSAPEFLQEKFQDYDKSQEAFFQSRLEKIEYSITSEADVLVLLTGARSDDWRSMHIEDSIFLLIVLLMRRHCLRMQLAARQAVDEDDLRNDAYAIYWVTNVLWNRFSELKEQLLHQDVSDLKTAFEWISCGLFKRYFDWDSATSDKFFLENDFSLPPNSNLELMEVDAIKSRLNPPKSTRTEELSQPADVTTDTEIAKPAAEIVTPVVPRYAAY